MHKPFEIKIGKEKQSFLLIAYISFGILFFFSFIFFRERIVFSDPAYQLFKILTFKEINIEASRYGAILPQLPVLLGMKLGLSLKVLTIIFSLSYMLLYFLVFIVCTHFLRNIAAGLSIVLVLILNVSESFFHPVSETHQALVFAILVFAILHYPGFRYSFVQFLLAASAIALAFFTHPIAVYPLVFVIGYVTIDKKQFRSIMPYALIILVGALTIGKLILTETESYEGKFFSQLLHSFSMNFSLMELKSASFFVHRIHRLYFWVLLLEIGLVVLFIHKKKYKELIWQLACTGLFFGITFLTYSHGDAEMLMERAYMPFALFVAVPLLNEMMDIKGYSLLKAIALMVVIGFSFNRIYGQGEVFQKRTSYNLELLKKTARFPNRKFVVKKSDLQKHILVSWTHGFEMIILSALTEDMPTQAIYAASDDEDLSKYIDEPNNIFLGTNFWLEWGVQHLNQSYFVLPRDTAYKFIDIEILK